MKQRTILSLTIFALFFVSIAFILGNKVNLSAINNIYFVSKSGSDLNLGTSQEPFLTIQKAVDTATSGDIIYVLAGTYQENVIISNRTNSESQPLRIVGYQTSTSEYPIIDGGDASFTNLADEDNAGFYISNSSWISIERFKIINSSVSSISITGSNYITVRRNIIDYLANGVRVRTNSHHILIELNEIFQSYPEGSGWTDLKSSKWEGGGVNCKEASGYNTIRNNYFHRNFNAIYFTRGIDPHAYNQANTWIHDNRFEDIVDDPFEPEAFTYNLHFYNNTFINTHRMVSLAPGGLGDLQGPIYIYNNIQIIRSDPTLEAITLSRANSALKVDLNTGYFSNNAYFFNNSVDTYSNVVNGYGVDILNSNVKYLQHYNNAYNTINDAINETSLTLTSSFFNYDISNTSFGITETTNWSNLDPGFSDPINEDLRLIAGSNSIGKARSIILPIGFSDSTVINEGDDLGAYQYNENTFRSVPAPIYALPPGGDFFDNATTLPWLADEFGGPNPPSGPIWASNGTWTYTNPLGDTPTPTIDPTQTLTPTPTTVAPTPTYTIQPTNTVAPTNTPIIIPTTIAPTSTIQPTNTVAPTNTPIIIPTTIAATSTTRPTNTVAPTNTTAPTATTIRIYNPTSTPMAFTPTQNNTTPMPSVSSSPSMTPTVTKLLFPTDKIVPSTTIRLETTPKITPINQFSESLGSILGIELANTIVGSPIISLGLCLIPIIIGTFIVFMKKRDKDKEQDS
jgi:hypothetical protein